MCTSALHRLRKYFNQASKMKYLQTLVKIPELGPDPPSFLLPGQLIEMELARQVRLTALLDEEASIGSLIEPGEVEPPEPLPPPQPRPPPEPKPPPTSQFDSQFGAAKTNDRFDFERARSPVKDERYVLRQIMHFSDQLDCN